MGTDAIVLDPRNPENILLILREEPENSISLIGGFINNLKPKEAAVFRFRSKVKTSDDSDYPIADGSLGMAEMESMTLQSTSRNGPFLGIRGNPDRSPGHIIASSYHLVTSAEAAEKFEPLDSRVLKVISCKMIDTLAKNVNQFVPKSKLADHFLTKYASANDLSNLEECGLELHHDHIFVLYQFYAKVVLAGILDKESGLVTDFGTNNAGIYNLDARDSVSYTHLTLPTKA